MRLIKFILASLLVIPSCSFAMEINSYFQQGAIIINATAFPIAVTDHAIPQITNYPITSGNDLEATFSSDRFTNPNGQTFSHTFEINSGVDGKLICTVTSHLEIGLTSLHLTQPTTSNPDKCETTNHSEFGSHGTIFASVITVK